MISKLILLVCLVGALEARSSVYPCPIFGLGRLAHSWSCSSYVQCVNGDAVEVGCAPGLHFNAQIEECIEPARAACTVEDNPCPVHTDSLDMVYLTDAQNCENYYLCYDNQPQRFQCAPGYLWDPVRQFCNIDYRVNCAPLPPTCPTGENRRMPNLLDCFQFYHCVNGVAFGAHCRKGLMFDSLTASCKPINEALCVQAEITTTTAQPTTPINTSWPHNESTELPITTVAPQTTPMDTSWDHNESSTTPQTTTTTTPMDTSWPHNQNTTFPDTTTSTPMDTSWPQTTTFATTTEDNLGPPTFP